MSLHDLSDAHRLCVFDRNGGRARGLRVDCRRLFVALAFDLLDGPLLAAEYPAQIQTVAETAVQQVGGSSSGLTTQLIAAEILAAYPRRNYDSPGQALATVITHASFACPALITAQLLSRHAGHAIARQPAAESGVGLFTPASVRVVADRLAAGRSAFSPDSCRCKLLT